jgi:hypothetical protein
MLLDRQKIEDIKLSVSWIISLQPWTTCCKDITQNLKHKLN